MLSMEGLEWGETKRDIDWYQAMEWGGALTDGWRIPTRWELLSALDSRIEGFETNYYWSSSEYNTNSACIVYFTNGTLTHDPKSNHYNVRCVRGVNEENNIQKYVFEKNIPGKVETILEEAHRITDGDRARDYDSPEDNFKRIADYWNQYLRHKNDLEYGTGKAIWSSVSPMDVSQMMVLMKLARQDFKHKRDNLVDACGYLRCTAKIMGEEK